MFKLLFYACACRNLELSFFSNLITDPLHAAEGGVFEPEMGRFVESKFGNTLLLDKEGFVYLVKHKMKNSSKIHWACREFKKEKCYAKALTEGIYVTRWKGEHNHPLRPVKLQNYDRKYGIK